MRYPTPVMRYKFRAECATDVGRLLGVIGNDMDDINILHVYSFAMSALLADVTVTFLSPLPIDDIRTAMRKVPDGHVMAETVGPEAEYTGLRP